MENPLEIKSTTTDSVSSKDEYHIQVYITTSPTGQSVLLATKVSKRAAGCALPEQGTWANQTLTQEMVYDKIMDTVQNLVRKVVNEIEKERKSGSH